MRPDDTDVTVLVTSSKHKHDRTSTWYDILRHDLRCDILSRKVQQLLSAVLVGKILPRYHINSALAPLPSVLICGSRPDRHYSSGSRHSSARFIAVLFIPSLPSDATFTLQGSRYSLTGTAWGPLPQYEGQSTRSSECQAM